MSLDLDPLGTTIKELRAIRGWSQSQLADKAGVAQGTVRRLEDGVGETTIQTAVAVADAFDADPSDLLDDAGL
jgi:transcriptional regulator with XRE-family HTH domain